jgi:hypothetical protein
MKILLINILFVVIILGCSPTAVDYSSQESALNGLDAREAISLTNQWRTSYPKITSYVTPLELIVNFPDNKLIKKLLPVDSLYIAVAPYITNTHTCATHYISSCDAELKSKSFNVVAKDSSSGVIYFDKTLESLNNGFIELWLPRNKTIHLHIVYNNLNTDGYITTTDNSNTCITTMQLK